MNVLVFTSPLVQLNSPYPSGAYLNSYFKLQGHNSCWVDLSVELFYSIFCRSGIEKLFELSEEKALKMADQAELQGDENTAFNIRRYVSTRQNWINWIDDIVAILCGKAREKEHQFLFSPFSPRGSRMENFLAGLSQEPSVDDVRFLCSYALTDLADYITAVFDPSFSLIRYAEHLTVEDRSFEQIEKNLDSPVMKHFFEPVLEKLISKTTEVPQLICISIPFAGTFLPGLYAARFFKQHFGNKTFIAAGGGFINTELRAANDPALGKYIDGFSYDRGYGSYKRLEEMGLDCAINNPSSIYKMRFFIGSKVLEPLWEDKDAESFEAKMTSTVIPDYTDIDFSRYPRVCDDKNAMHRIWNDGAWVKAYLAHGCYWHKCAFCDTQLDYVCGYKPVEIEALYNGLLETARQKGIYGIHFVDEALPPIALKNFGILNARNGNPLYFWGNIRFEKTFTKDLAAFLSYCGFGGASAGLEVATGEGLKSINKGTDIDSIISACAALKEAGILVHAYMIYGFWHDTPQSIINSMETLRQCFEAGLLDSSFWHKFVLTRNSQVYSEWLKGKHKELQPVEPKQTRSIFANNNLHFKGENSFDKFGIPLESALNSWMHNDKLEMKVQKWFDFPVPSPSIPRDFINQGIENYDKKNISRWQNLSKDNIKNLYWIGSKPVKNGNAYRWIFIQEEYSVNKLQMDITLLDGLRPEGSDEVRKASVQKLQNNPGNIKELRKFLGKGLCLLDF